MLTAVGFICAMPREFECLREASGLDWEELSGSPFTSFVAERGEIRMVAAVSGIGKTLAAAASQFLVDRHSPSRLVSFGLAGALAAHMVNGDVALPRGVLQGDVGVHHRGGFSHPLSWRSRDEGLALSHQRETEETLRCPLADSLRHQGLKVHEEPLVTCDQVVLSRSRREELHNLTSACAVDMESVAVAIVAGLNGLPFLVVRTISDTLDMEVEDGSLLFLLESGRRADRLRLVGRLASSGEVRRSLSAFREGSRLAYRNLASAGKALLELLYDTPLC